MAKIKGAKALPSLSCPQCWSNFLDMRRNFFLGYLLAELFTIVAVTIIFKEINDRQIAATIAGVLFVSLPAILIALEYRRAGFKEIWWFVSVLQFWILFALPILGLRVFNWGVSFEQLAFLGISGPILHQWSSKSYIVMVMVTAWTRWRIKRADQ